MNVFLFAGETSGDLHGGHLMQALREYDKEVSFYGVGGPLMRQERLECFIEMEQFQVMGFTDVIRSLPHLWKLFRQTVEYILKLNPACAILIDYPGFNLRLAAALRKKGFRGKLVQYICPSVWAHGRKRIDVLAQHYDLLLTIFPFEAPLFSHTSLKVAYIGNPLGETIRQYAYQSDWADQIGLSLKRKIIALFPGSRQGEIQRHVPLQLRAAALLKEKEPECSFALSCAHENLQNALHDYVKTGPLTLDKEIWIVPSLYRYDLMRSCAAALAKSGTITLELAYHAVPTVVHYEVSPLNYLFAKYILKLNLPHYCIVNILGNRTIYPEIIGLNNSPEEIQTQLTRLLAHAPTKEQIRKDCGELIDKLGNQSAHHAAAKAILEVI